DGEPQVKDRLPWRRRVPLRRRVTGAIVTVTVAAVAVFAAPLAYAVRQLYRNEELSTLQRDAVRIASAVPDLPQDVPANMPARPAGVGVAVRFGVYDTAGVRLAGDGPQRSALAALASDGRTHTQIDGAFEASAPVPSDGRISVTVLTMSSAEAVNARTRRTWAVMAGLAVLVLLLSAGFARLLARRLARPLEDLTAAARALGDGDFTAHTRPSGVLEVDDAGQALERTSARLAQVRERERSFARDASHQLRTPLAGLLLGIENALAREPDADRQALRQALDRGLALQAIVDDLLALTRSSPVTTASVSEVLLATQDRWHGVLAQAGRRLVVRLPDRATRAAAPAAALRQILDVLVDNAFTHGGGTVTVAAGEVADGVSIVVSDEGSGPGGGPVRAGGGGLGLPLARRLAASSGALLNEPEPGATSAYRVLLPSVAAGQVAAS
ncbi:MAG: hypothetical protein QOI42_894, partial [Frankiaceae bacterium]|nr:hypothetical protein [Frankiaceae bacterium]